MTILRDLASSMCDTAPIGSPWEHMIRASKYVKECRRLQRFDVLCADLDQRDLEEMYQLIARFLACMVTGDAKGLDAIMSERSFVRESAGLSPEASREWYIGRHPHLANPYVDYDICDVGIGQYGLYLRLSLLYSNEEPVHLTIYLHWNDPNWKIAEIHKAI